MRQRCGPRRLRRAVIRAAGGATLGAGVLVSRMPAIVGNAQASPVPIVPGADWPLALGNPVRSGVAVDAGPEGEPELIWRFETGLSGTRALLVIVDGTVLTMGALLGSAALVGLDLQTGDMMWLIPMEFQPFAPCPRSPMVSCIWRVYRERSPHSTWRRRGSFGRRRWMPAPPPRPSCRMGCCTLGPTTIISTRSILQTVASGGGSRSVQVPITPLDHHRPTQAA